MSNRNHRAHRRTLSVEDAVTVAFHKVASHKPYSDQDEHDDDDEELAVEWVYLHRSCHVSCDVEQQQEEDEERQLPAGGSEGSLEGSEKKTLACCITSNSASRRRSASKAPEKPETCPGLGLFYGLLSTVFFSTIALLVKTIQGLHAVEISAIRCFFQILFVVPLLIYHKTGFIGPRDKRIYLVLRGFLGSNAMILLFYAVHQMPLADATVIMFSNPVLTSLLAWVFLKEKCTIWDCVFTVFTLTGVILIARPPFLFGEHVGGIESNYSNHIKGTIAAFAGALAAACTMVILRKLGKSVHYYLSVWYYAVIGLIECIITVSVLGEWRLPFCGRDRWMLVLIAILGITGQAFLTKALQIENAGPVALMRTMEVMLAFIFQFIFFNHPPNLWSLGGALCIVASTSGIALRKWFCNSRKT